MTTIVCDGSSMGCDGQITFGDTIAETDCLKVRRLNDGALIGFAGNTYNWESIIDHLNEVAELPEDSSDDDTPKWPELNGYQDTLILEKNGSIYLYDHLGRRFERTAPIAIGSGAKYAIAAMDCGADIREAIEIACKRDIHSSGTIRVIPLNEES